MYRFLFIINVLFWSFCLSLAQSVTPDSLRIIRPEISYVGELAGNLDGGIKKGTCYLGMANLAVGFSTEAAKFWNGGYFFVNLANTHGGEPSADFFGDIQVASNIEAGDHTYLQEVWYSQSWNFVKITLGLQDMNVDFANTPVGGLFLNSSFGILPTISGNIPAPIFPLTSLGLSTDWKLSEGTRFLAAIYDGSATDFEDNPHNLKWDLQKGEGLLLFGEIDQDVMVNGLPGIYKGGIYLHQHLIEEEDHDADIDSGYKNNNGIYIIADQMFWQHPNKEKGLSAMVQIGLSPRRHNLNKYFVGFGLSFKGVLSRHGKDIAGLAVAHDGLRGNIGSETTYEFSYQYTLFDLLFFQPDIQYIVNPSGSDEHVKNCLSAFLRFGINF